MGTEVPLQFRKVSNCLIGRFLIEGPPKQQDKWGESTPQLLTIAMGGYKVLSCSLNRGAEKQPCLGGTPKGYAADDDEPSSFNDTIANHYNRLVPYFIQRSGVGKIRHSSGAKM